jgi:hypothetical protein
MLYTSHTQWSLTQDKYDVTGAICKDQIVTNSPVFYAMRVLPYLLLVNTRIGEMGLSGSSLDDLSACSPLRGSNSVMQQLAFRRRGRLRVPVCTVYRMFCGRLLPTGGFLEKCLPSARIYFPAHLSYCFQSMQCDV